MTISFIDAKHERATVILTAIRAKPGSSMTQLANLTGIPAPVVWKYLASFTEKNWIDCDQIGVEKFYQISPQGCNALSFFKWMCEPGLFREMSIKIMDKYYRDESDEDQTDQGD